MQIVQPDSQTFQIIGAAMEVHRQLHRGLYKGFTVPRSRLNSNCDGFHSTHNGRFSSNTRGDVSRVSTIWISSVSRASSLEVKAASALTPADESQLLNYLAMTRLQRGLLINFGAKSSVQKGGFCNRWMREGK